MGLPAAHPFRKHADNYRAVAAGLTQAERAHKRAIRDGDEAATDFAARMHQLMVGLIAEAQLRKIISDPGGFNAKEQQLLSQERSQLDKWLRAVELAIRRHYSVPLHLEIDTDTTDADLPTQHATIEALLRKDLALIIEDRNKLAHAQWRWLLNNRETAFTGPAEPPLNYLAAKRRSEVINLLAGLIHALVVSEPTFRRDYDKLFREIAELRVVIDGSDTPSSLPSCDPGVRVLHGVVPGEHECSPANRLGRRIKLDRRESFRYGTARVRVSCCAYR